MTVSATTSKVTFAGDGATTAFGTTPVKFYQSSDLQVYLVAADGTPTLQTIGTHYTVTGGSGSTGTVTMVTAPAVGADLEIQRVLPLSQLTDPENNDINDAAVLEEALDRAVMVMQQLQEAVDRAIKLPVGQVGVSLPVPAALKHLRWNALANSLENVDITSLGALSLPLPIAQGGTNGTTLATALTNLGLDTAMGQCALEWESNNALRLRRRGGKKLMIDGALRDVPAAGVALIPSDLASNDVAYYIYAYMSGSNMVLEASTTGYTRDTTYGHMTKTGDTTRSLVGMAAKNGGLFYDVPSRRYTRTWYNDQGIAGLHKLPSNTAFVGNNAWAWSGYDLPVLVWAGETVHAIARATATTPTGTSFMSVTVGVDGLIPIATDNNPQTVTLTTANHYAHASAGVVHAPNEGRRLYSLVVRFQSGISWTLQATSAQDYTSSGVELRTSGTRP